MSLLRVLRSAAPARAFSTSALAAEAKVAVRATHSTDHVAPADVVAGKAPGPVTVHESARDIAADQVSDAPAELRHRAVRIFKPTKNTMQSAKGKTKVWRIDWDVLQGAGRWTNPLMGWASSADYMQGTTLAFRTRQDAIRFVSSCRKRRGIGVGVVVGVWMAMGTLRSRRKSLAFTSAYARCPCALDAVPRTQRARNVDGSIGYRSLLSRLDFVIRQLSSFRLRWLTRLPHQISN